MSYGILPSFSSKLYSVGNMNNEASSSSTFQDRRLVDIPDDEKVTLYSNNFQFDPDVHNYCQQPEHKSLVDNVHIQRPFMIDYQSAVTDSNHTPVLLQPLSPRIQLSGTRCQQSLQPMVNPKKRMNDVRDHKKHAHQEQIQRIRRVKRVPVRRSQKLADKITALQKLVSPYGKTDTASVLQEAHISINLLHDQIQKLLQDTQHNEDVETAGLCNKGLCLVPISSLDQINGACLIKQKFTP